LIVFFHVFPVHILAYLCYTNFWHVLYPMGYGPM